MNDRWFTESVSDLDKFCDSKECLDGVSPSLLPVLSDAPGPEVIAAPREVPSPLTAKGTLCSRSAVGG